LKNKLEMQETEYNFPYHYVPSINTFFQQHKNMSWGYIYLSYIQFVVDIINDYKFELALDIGCGDGRFPYELRKNNKDIYLEGTDISEQAVAYAIAFNKKADIVFSCGDITKEENLNKKFKCITLIETLEHISPGKINLFLKSLSDKLHENGKLILTVPSKNVKVDDKHFQHFDIETIEFTIKDFFEIEDFYYVNSKSRFVKRIDKIVSNKNFIITNKKLVNWLFDMYCKYYFFCETNKCKRIIGILRKI